MGEEERTAGLSFLTVKAQHKYEKAGVVIALDEKIVKKITANATAANNLSGNVLNSVARKSKNSVQTHTYVRLSEFDEDAFAFRLKQTKPLPRKKTKEPAPVAIVAIDIVSGAACERRNVTAQKSPSVGAGLGIPYEKLVVQKQTPAPAPGASMARRAAPPRGPAPPPAPATRLGVNPLLIPCALLYEYWSMSNTMATYGGQVSNRSRSPRVFFHVCPRRLVRNNVRRITSGANNPFNIDASFDDIGDTVIVCDA